MGRKPKRTQNFEETISSSLTKKKDKDNIFQSNTLTAEEEVCTLKSPLRCAVSKDSEIGISQPGQPLTPSSLIHPLSSRMNVSSVSVAGESFCSDSTFDEDAQEGLVKVEEMQVEKRRMKKERQKQRKMRRKLVLERKQSMHLLLDLEGSSSESLLDLDKMMKAVVEPSNPPPENIMCLMLHKNPKITLEYFLREIPCLILDFQKSCTISTKQCHSGLRLIITSFIMGSWIFLALMWVNSTDQALSKYKQHASRLFYWIFLGILSSAGFGSGLHTFLLYLGPFIAKVTMAAEECLTINFPEPPYPNQIICPPSNLNRSMEDPIMVPESPPVFSIVAKVRWESLLWGLGTAIGELPPYLFARAARLTGDSLTGNEKSREKVGCIQKIQNLIGKFIVKVGFWGILLSASIPNPLFDLAGITCGHFLVPFTTFFGATLVGKTVIKAHLQMLFVILAFNEKSFHRALNFVGQIPKVGHSMKELFADFLQEQKAAIRDGQAIKSGANVVKTVSDIFVTFLILYFIFSIVNGMAQSYYKRITTTKKALNKKRKEKYAAKAKRRRSNQKNVTLANASFEN